MQIQKNPELARSLPRIWTSLELINWTKAYFEKQGVECARLEAELLLAAVLGCPRIRLYVDFEKTVPPDKLNQFREYIKRRGEAREPLQYILGSTQFIDLQLKVSKHVLIPRPETELLALWAVEQVSSLLRTSEPSASEVGTYKALDLCTGSGCMALYLASKQPQAQVHATDASAEALSVAAENASALQLASRVIFHQGDLFDALPTEHKGSFDLLIANPPYVDPAACDSLSREVRDHEPPQALFADEKGHAVINRILAGADEWLKPGAWLSLEFGFGQADAVKDRAESVGAFENIEILSDAAKIQRFIIARRKF
ncbi:MAG: peptide chain release factor N(5)-glutamine methyltransferase [Planctomycetota bacterium]